MEKVWGLTGWARDFLGAAPGRSCDEARYASERETQNILCGARRRQVNLDYRFHLDDAGGDLDEP